MTLGCNARHVAAVPSATIELWGNITSIPSKRKTPHRGPVGRERVISLTMSYFHTRMRTIIGAEAFHCPVRDGKEWDHLAMVIRLNR
jgi:hypothetical protein